MDKTTFGELLCLLRNRENMKQEELADVLNVSKSAVSKWECGKNYPDFEMLKRLSELFHISCDDLLYPERTLSRMEQGQEIRQETGQEAQPKMQRETQQEAQPETQRESGQDARLEATQPKVQWETQQETQQDNRADARPKTQQEASENITGRALSYIAVIGALAAAAVFCLVILGGVDLPKSGGGEELVESRPVPVAGRETKLPIFGDDVVYELACVSSDEMSGEELREFAEDIRKLYYKGWDMRRKVLKISVYSDEMTARNFEETDRYVYVRN